MNKILTTQLVSGLSPTPSNAESKAHRYCWVVAGLMGLAANTGSAATDVAAGSNLTTHINNATAASHEFNLLGDVTMNGIGYLNSTARQNIFIDANGFTITKNTNENIFWITGRQNASLTIRNANITSKNSGASYGTISVDSGSANAVIDLDGTRIFGTTGIAGAYSGALSTHAKNTLVKGNVTFDSNHSTGDSGGAVAVGAHASLQFADKVTFENNYTGHYGGAVSVRENGSLTFQDDAIFTGNYTTSYFGGAVDIWSGTGKVIFEKDATFTGNYVKNTSAHGYGARGGAIHIGYIAGSVAPQVEMHGTSTFDGNYVWGRGNTVGVGGAFALAAAAGDPLSNSQISSGFAYGATFDNATFTNNYAYSETGNGYGGAVFAKSYNAQLDFGNGSTFTGNMAKTLGGAIYFDQGAINLKGNVTFSGNRHGVSFSTADGKPAPVSGSGQANAIYFAVSSNTATLNLNNNQGEVINFSDPIESAAGKTVIVNKTGLGKVIFNEHDSNIMAQTTVSGGTFELGAGAGYGRVGSASTSFFRLGSAAKLQGGSNAILRASTFDLAGRIEVTEGKFYFDGGNIAMHDTTVLSLTITDASNYSSIDLGGRAIELNAASLEIMATGYVPSQNVSDTFTIVSGIGGQPTGYFLQGETIAINGADFQIVYGTNDIVLRQLTVPEPSTYAMILGAATLGFIWLRRKR